MGKLVRMPESEELRAFCAAVELGSLGRAARLLGVSQPAITKRIQGLENLVGVHLLDRSSQGVSATPAGEQLHAQAREFLNHAKALSAVMGDLRGGEVGSIQLAVSHTIAEAVLPTMISEFEQSQKRISIELLSANSPVVRRQVAEGRVEIGIAARCPVIAHPDQLDERPFCNDEVVLAIPHGHRWRTQEEISLDEFLSEPIVMRDTHSASRLAVEGTLSAHDLGRPTPLLEVGSSGAALQAALAHRAPILISSLLVPPPLAGEEPPFAVRPVSGLSFSREFVLLCADPATLATPARALYAYLSDSAADA
jgi:DNA-binding transcriptional LysR family regulator